MIYISKCARQFVRVPKMVKTETGDFKPKKKLLKNGEYEIEFEAIKFSEFNYRVGEKIHKFSQFDSDKLHPIQREYLDEYWNHPYSSVFTQDEIDEMYNPDALTSRNIDKELKKANKEKDAYKIKYEELQKRFADMERELKAKK